MTSTIHVRRASWLLDQCYRGQLFTVATPLRNGSRYEMPVQVPHEWGGLLITLTAHRG